MISELSLQRGRPIDIGICKVYPLTLGEIEEMGEVAYNQYLSSLLLDKDSINLNGLSKEEIEDILKMSAYEILLLHCIGDKLLSQLILQSFFIFLKEKVQYQLIESEDTFGFFYIGDLSENRIITPQDFEQIKEIIQRQNYLQEKKEKKFKAANDKTKALMEKMQKEREKIQEKNKKNALTLPDIISIVSNYGEGINVLNVWNLTIYQLYESYLRIIMWDEYHNNFLLLPHVKDSESLGLKHWASKINN